VPELRVAVLEFMSAATVAAQAVLEGIALALGLDATYFRAHYTADPTVLFRIFRYPPARPEDDVWGVGEHTDYGLLTLLLQDDVGGLQVKSRDGWIDVPPVDGALVCNLGDMLDRLTGGEFRSTPHRVRNTSGRERFSFPFFFDPSFDARIAPLPESSAYRRTPLDEAITRWDHADVHAFDGTYGDYLLAKVARVFPDLAVPGTIPTPRSPG
jgi:isopenicillin N synthase-like dioxygenase